MWKWLYVGGVDILLMIMISGLNVEQVEVDVSVVVGWLGDLMVKLILLSGSESILLDWVGKKLVVNDIDMGSVLFGEFNYIFMLIYYCGEDFIGQWKLVVKDVKEGLFIKFNCWLL